MSIETGKTLGHYKVISSIGAGGMGEVYLAEDTKLDRKIALKVLPAEVAKNTDRMQRFIREAKAASSLNHPNIAHIYEIGEADCMSYLAGRSSPMARANLSKFSRNRLMADGFRLTANRSPLCMSKKKAILSAPQLPRSTEVNPPRRSRLPRHLLRQLCGGHLTDARSYMRTGRKAVSAISSRSRSAAASRKS